MRISLHHSRLFLIGISLLHLIYFGFQLVQQNYLLADSREYLWAAENWLNAGTWYSGDLSAPIDLNLYTKRPPGYPAFLLLFHSIGGIPLLLAAQNLLSIFSLWLGRKLFIHLGYNPKYDYLLLIALICSPSLFIYANVVMAETLLGFLIITAVWSLQQYISSVKWKWLLLMQLALCAALLVKPVMYLWIVPNILFLLVLLVKQKKLRFSWLLLIPLLAIITVSMRNHKITGSYSYSSIQKINLVYYNAYYFNIRQVGYEAATAELDSMIRITDQMPYQQGWNTLQHWGISKIKQAPAEYLLFHLRGMVTFLIDPGRFDLYHFFDGGKVEGIGLLQHFSAEGLSGAWSYIRQLNPLLVAFLILIAIGRTATFIGAACFSAFNLKSVVSLYMLLLIAYLTFATGPLGASRFAVPVVPLLLFMAVTAFSIFQKKKSLPDIY